MYYIKEDIVRFDYEYKSLVNCEQVDSRLFFSEISFNSDLAESLRNSGTIDYIGIRVLYGFKRMYEDL